MVQTVHSVTTSDGHGTSSLITCNYDGAKWSNLDRSFLGFGYVNSVIDAAGDYTETFYHQHDGCISKPDYTFIKLPGGAVLSSSAMQYSESDSAPWSSLMTTRTDNNCEGTSACLTTQTNFFYDQYANVLETDELGNANLGGDERSTIIGYSYNTSQYIVGLMAYQNTYAGINSGGTLLRSTRNVYDNNTSYTQAPTQGILKRRQCWDSTTGGTADTVYFTDPTGNVLTTTDPMGGTNTTTFDPVCRAGNNERFESPKSPSTILR